MLSGAQLPKREIVYVRPPGAGRPYVAGAIPANTAARDPEAALAMVTGGSPVAASPVRSPPEARLSRSRSPGIATPARPPERVSDLLRGVATALKMGLAERAEPAQP